MAESWARSRNRCVPQTPTCRRLRPQDTRGCGVAMSRGALVAGCGGGRALAKTRHEWGGFDIAGVNLSHKPMRAVSPDDIPIVFCTRCGGACIGHKGGLIKSCVEIHDKDSRLKRLAKGLHPCFKYKYHINVLGPARS